MIFPTLQIFLSILLCFVLIVSAVEPIRVKIPEAAMLGGRPVPAGLYRIEIDETAENPYLRFIRNGQMIAADVAIVLPARGAAKTIADATEVAGKKLIRIRVRQGEKWYFVYLKV